MGKDNKKQYVVRKYIFAASALEAIKLEKKYRVDEVFVDDEWKKAQDATKPVSGFNK